MIPALSIRQPWAWLIVNGYKDIENRDWPTVFRGRMLIHAGLTMSRSYYDETVAYLYDEGILDRDIEIPPFEALERGGLVGFGQLGRRALACVWRTAGAAFGRHGLGRLAAPQLAQTR